MNEVFDLESAASKIFSFNDIAGNYTDIVSKEHILAQIVLIEEELNEMKLGVKAYDDLETLDGMCDVLVTVIGLSQMLERNGYDVVNALNAVCDNNLEKYPKDQKRVMDTIVMYINKGITATWQYLKDLDVYVIKNPNTGKILKPLDFPKVNLVPFVGEIVC
jgi:hypothetical protein